MQTSRGQRNKAHRAPLAPKGRFGGSKGRPARRVRPVQKPRRGELPSTEVVRQAVAEVVARKQGAVKP